MRLASEILDSVATLAQGADARAFDHRLAVATGKPAAQLMYQNGTDRVTLYITAAAPGTKGFETESQKGLSAYFWANAQIACTVVGDLPQSKMQGLADGVYRQLGATAGSETW